MKTCRTHAARNQPLRNQTHDRLSEESCIKASRAHNSHLLQFPLISRLRTEEGRPPRPPPPAAGELSITPAMAGLSETSLTNHV